jgi:hypothetical protein
MQWNEAWEWRAFRYLIFRKISRLKLSRESDHSDWDILWLSSVISNKFEKNAFALTIRVSFPIQFLNARCYLHRCWASVAGDELRVLFNEAVGCEFYSIGDEWISTCIVKLSGKNRSTRRKFVSAHLVRHKYYVVWSSIEPSLPLF